MKPARHPTTTNEAELQARLAERLRTVLPALPADIRLERHIRLRLGHHKVIVDGMSTTAGSVRGRYDVLVVVNEDPLLLAELKAPDVEIDEEDVSQALSYARLHDPLVPLVFVTNGATSQLVRTYDGVSLERDDIAPARLSDVLQAASSVAAAATDDAVRALLGSSRESWIQILRTWTAKAVERLSGEVRDFARPVARELMIPRNAVSDIVRLLDAETDAVVLHGPPLSGVTNVLVQLCTRELNRPVLLIDGTVTPDVLQFMANRLSRELAFGVSKDDLRRWFNTGRDILKVILVVDGVPRDGIDELLEYASAGIIQLVVGLDTDAYNRHATLPGRTQSSLLGDLAKPVELQPLTDAEFSAALDAIEQKFGALFFNGAQHVSELRWPRTLRVMAAALPRRIAASQTEDGDRVTRLMLLPIPGPLSLQASATAFVNDPQTKFDLTKLAEAFLVEVEQANRDVEWIVATWGRPSLEPEQAEKHLGEQRLQRLSERGFLSWFQSSTLGPRFLVRVEELLLERVSAIWSKRLCDAAASSSSRIEQELDVLLNASGLIPAGELALAAAIFAAGSKSPELLGACVQSLMHREPRTSRLTEGTRVELLVTDRRIRLHFREGMDEEVVGEIQPWLVLSHLATWPMAADGDKWTVNASIFARLGAFRHLLYTPRPSELASLRGIHVHEIHGLGTFPCIGSGIVEPLLQAMLHHMHSHPNELVALAEYALESREAHLAWRVLTVALAAESATDESTAQAASDIVTVLRDWWHEALTEAIEHGDAALSQGGHGGPGRES